MAKFTGHTITSDSALGDAKIQRSLRFDNTNTGYLNRTAGTSTSQYKFTFSAWVKLGRTVEATTDYGELFNGYAGSNNNSGFGAIYFYNGGLRFAGWSTTYRATSRLFRDAGAWYHIVVAVDSTLGTADNRQKIYINGVEETSFSTSNNLGQNDTFGIGNNSTVMQIGRDNSASSDRSMDGYMAEINFIDGQQLDPSYFGFTDPVTNIWMPKRYEGTYGTNGFHLDFSDNSSAAALGIDKSPNGNDFTPNNFSVAAGAGNDSLEDTPTNNFSTINPLAGYTTTFEVPTNGNLDFSLATNEFAFSTFEIPTSGKWYAEVLFTTVESGRFGITNQNIKNSVKWNGIEYDVYLSGSIAIDNSVVQSSLGAIVDDDIGGIQVDRDAGTVVFTINGTAKGTAVNISSLADSSQLVFVVGRGSSSGSAPVGSINYGQRPFSYLPTGYKALCSANLPPTSPSVVRPKKHFDTLLWTGNSTNNRVITGLEFQPDLVWIKKRNVSIMSHYWVSSVQTITTVSDGNGNNGTFVSGTNETDAEGQTTDGGFVSFNEDGFTLGKGDNDANSDSAYQRNNANSANYVAWCWKAGGNSNTFNVDGKGYASASAAGITDGSIALTSASVNTEAGFSMVTYTGTNANGATIAHGLGKVPKWYIVKRRNSSGAWMVYHEGIGNTHNFYLNTHEAAQDDDDFANDTSPTSSVFTLGISGFVNASGGTYVAYCWAEIPGYSKFGTYIANDAEDGPFVDCGFRPGWLVIKRVNGNGFYLTDTKRLNGNSGRDNAAYFQANTSGQEETTENVDILSNGFKPRQASGYFNNAAGDSFVFMAFAEEPGTTPFDTFPNAR